MIRAFLVAIAATVLTACGAADVDPDTRDLLRRDMNAVAIAVAAEDYLTANDALSRLVGDTEAAYLAGKLTSSQRSDIVDAAAEVQADLDATLAPPETQASDPIVPDVSGGTGSGGDDGGNGNGKGKDKGNSGNNGNGNGKGKN